MKLSCHRFIRFQNQFNTFSIVILQPGLFLLISFASAKPSPELPPVMTTCFGSIAPGKFTLRKRKIKNKTVIAKIIEEERVIGMKNSIIVYNREEIKEIGHQNTMLFVRINVSFYFAVKNAEYHSRCNEQCLHMFQLSKKVTHMLPCFRCDT